MFRKLVYCQSLSPATDNVTGQLGAEVAFRMNSLFDPDFSAGAHQPYGFDQLATLYDKYVVHGVTVDIVLSTVPYSTGGATNIVALAGCTSTQPSSSNVAIQNTSINNVEESNVGTITFLEAAGRVSRYRQSFKISDIEGITPTQLRANVEEYAAPMNSNPVRTPWLRFALANLSSTAVLTAFARVRLEFDCEFFARTVLPPSN